MLKNRKGLGPIIATLLLMVVAIIAVIVFSKWFYSYQSRLNAGVEMHTNNNVNGVYIEKIINKFLYLRNGLEALTIKSVKIGGVDCNISGNYTGSLIKLNVSSCLDNLKTSTPEIVVETKSFVLSKEQYFKLSLSCSLDGVTLNSGDSYNFFNSSFSHDTCYSELRTCNNGVLSGDDTFQYSSCVVISGDLSCITDVDADGQISYTCAVYPMTNTTLEGHLDPNDNNADVVDDRCWLQGNKTNCTSNFVIDGCGSGTVLDKGTGLCWLRNMSLFPAAATWVDAINNCSSLDYAGHTDWSLPTKQELETIVDLSKYNPAIVGGTTIFTDVHLNGPYWTISTYVPTNANAWDIEFVYGDDAQVAKSGANAFFTCVVPN